VVHRKFTEEEWRLFTQLKKKNKLKTSSVGRLFDAVSSLLGICDKNTFEGAAAMRLEAAAALADRRDMKCLAPLDPQGNIPSKKLVEALHGEMRSGRRPEQLAGDFIFTLASLILEKAEREGIRKIAFSGGVFQNALLVDLLRQENRGFELYFHREFSPNDENIPFGQLMYHLNCT
jgi:hydrogenase maturation protein HypF